MITHGRPFNNHHKKALVKALAKAIGFLTMDMQSSLPKPYTQGWNLIGKQEYKPDEPQCVERSFDIAVGSSKCQ